MTIDGLDPIEWLWEKIRQWIHYGYGLLKWWFYPEREQW